jgi:hypothetical protein
MARRIRCSLLHTVLAVSGRMAHGQPWPRKAMDFGAPGVVLISAESRRTVGFFHQLDAVYAR